MKKRVSVDKSEWSDERENWYKNECIKIAFSFADELKIENDTVFLVRNGDEVQISNPLKRKTFWYETWLRLRAYYGID